MLSSSARGSSLAPEEPEATEVEKWGDGQLCSAETPAAHESRLLETQADGDNIEPQRGEVQSRDPFRLLEGPPCPPVSRAKPSELDFEPSQPVGFGL